MEVSVTPKDQKLKYCLLYFLLLVCPNKVLAHLPSITDHIFNLKSSPPLNKTTPEGKNLQLSTLAT